MTIVAIIARPDDFIIIGDTRQSGAHYAFPNDSKKYCYNDQEQKVFVSLTHRMGMCISGHGAVASSNPAEPVIRASYILQRFFKYADTKLPKKPITIEDIEDVLRIYLNTKFPNYAKNFFANVSLFYGGFNIKGNTQIYSLQAGNLETFEYLKNKPLETQLCAFSNNTTIGNKSLLLRQTEVYVKYFQQQSGKVLQNLSLKLNSGSLMKDCNELLCKSNYGEMFGWVVPSYRQWMVQDVGHDGTVGKTFDCFKVNSWVDPMPYSRQIFLLDDTMLPNTFQPTQNPINYNTVKTVPEMASLMISGVVSLYDNNDQLLTLKSGFVIP